MGVNGVPVGRNALGSSLGSRKRDAREANQRTQWWVSHTITFLVYVTPHAHLEPYNDINDGLHPSLEGRG